ncbi:hypothetical protein KSS87_006790 [Heliosperma pusillum]|nr:hypothetical protein KSS87_006790 [Heliosperma pusillum]
MLLKKMTRHKIVGGTFIHSDKPDASTPFNTQSPGRQAPSPNWAVCADCCTGLRSRLFKKRMIMSVSSIHKIVGGTKPDASTPFNTQPPGIRLHRRPVEHPHDAHLIRGNHKAADINGRFGFRIECIELMPLSRRKFYVCMVGSDDQLIMWSRSKPFSALLQYKVALLLWVDPPDHKMTVWKDCVRTPLVPGAVCADCCTGLRSRLFKKRMKLALRCGDECLMKLDFLRLE